MNVWPILALEYAILAVGFSIALSTYRTPRRLRPVTRRLRRDAQLAVWISGRRDESARIVRQTLIQKYPPGYLPVAAEHDPHGQYAFGVATSLRRIRTRANT